MRLPLAAALLIGSIAAPAVSLLSTRPAVADTCTPIATAADLQNIRRNFAGAYCLANDIDLAGVTGLVPLGSDLRPFTGTFDGQGHVLRNLALTSRRAGVGLFGVIDGGAVSNLTLAGVNITATRSGALVGAVAGAVLDGAVISDVRVTGSVTCTGRLCRAGGLVGELFGGTVEDSAADATVTSGHGGAAGGLVGQIDATVLRSYATGVVNCGSNCAAGGLAGQATDLASIDSSFATGPVHATRRGNAAGFIATLGDQGEATVTHSYATGLVNVSSGELAGAFAANYNAMGDELFAVGRIHAGVAAFSGGLAAAGDGSTTTAAYWDESTTRRKTSIAGVGVRTRQLQAALPAGFGSAWGITAGFSYPYLNLLDSGMFASTLATSVFGRNVYTFGPLSQLEPTEYTAPPAHADTASLAAVYTMLARGIGRGADVDTLENTKIDEFFWDDSTQTATFQGPVTDYAQLGGVLDIAAGDALDDSNVVGAMKARNVVIIRGTAADSSTHWMLATLFTADNGTTTAIVADDPWTGLQVRIDPTSKQVTSPANFPLTGFTVDGYAVVTFVTPP